MAITLTELEKFWIRKQAQIEKKKLEIIARRQQFESDIVVDQNSINTKESAMNTDIAALQNDINTLEQEIKDSV